jgi:hypothetical protein
LEDLDVPRRYRRLTGVDVETVDVDAPAADRPDDSMALAVAPQELGAAPKEIDWSPQETAELASSPMAFDGEDWVVE